MRRLTALKVPVVLATTMPKKPAKLRCPTCKKTVHSSAEDFPFCSQRCRLIDLGKWATGQYIISSPVHDISDAIGDSQPEDPKKS